MTDTQRRKITEIDIEIDDVLSVMGDGVQIEASADADAVDINALSWRLVEIRLSDRIGVTSVALSVPRERGWHTVTNLGNKFLVMHGGLSFRSDRFLLCLFDDSVQLYCNLSVSVLPCLCAGKGKCLNLSQW